MTAVLDPSDLTGFYRGRFVAGDDDGIYLLTATGAIPMAETELDELDRITGIGSDWFTYSADDQITNIAAPVSPNPVGASAFEGAVSGLYHGESQNMFIGLGVSLSRANVIPPLPGEPQVRLSPTSIAEDAEIGSVVGSLSVLNGTGSYTYSATADPDSKFAISGSNLVTDAALDYGTATSHSVTISADNGDDDPVSGTFAVSVIKVEPSLAPLTLSISEITVDVPVSIDIIGATAGSTITADQLPAGLTINSGARTITGTPTAIAETGVALTETLADSPNSPRVSNVSIAVVEAAPIVLPSNWRGAATFGDTGEETVLIQSEYDAFAGAPADFIFCIANHDSWLNFDATIHYWNAVWADDPRPKIWSIPSAVDGTSLAEVAGGSNDANFIAAAEAILADAANDNSAIIIRLAWEPNLAGLWAWTAIGVEADYIAAFRRIVGLFRSVSPRFRFDWNLNYVNEPDFDWTTIYPGDDVVDIIGFDAYYNPYFGEADLPVNQNPISTFDFYFDNIIADITAFAALHDKPMSVPEWGVGWEKPQWVELMAQWIESHDVVYHSYFDNNRDPAHQTRMSDGSKGLAGHAYLMNFGEDVPVYGEGAFDSAVPGVIGAGGSLPTGWAGQGQSGATIEVIGTTVMDQVECLVLEIAADGTGAPNSQWAEIFLPYSWGDGPAAEEDEVWRASVAVQIQNSEGAGASLYGLKLFELSSASNSSDYPPVDRYDEFPIYAAHHTVMRKLTEAGTTSVAFEFDAFLDPTESPSSSRVLIAAPRLTEAL